MRHLSLPTVLALAAAILAGCGAAPSTPLAPDKPAPPDAGKLPPETVDRLLQGNHADDRR